VEASVIVVPALGDIAFATLEGGEDGFEGLE
jgi:hypothetical protein